MPGKILSVRANSHGYLSARVMSGGKIRTYPMHRLVLEAFTGVRPKGMQCLHRDGNKLNTCLWNLSWGTSKQNARDKVMHGTMASGERNGWSKLKESQVIEIRERYLNGEKPKILAQEFGVNRNYPRLIANGTVWLNRGNI